MKSSRETYAHIFVIVAIACCVTGATAARAQTDEIQVYDGAIAAPGKLNLMLHKNYTPSGSKVPAFPGAIVANHSLNGVPEWAYGVTDWFEAGVYLPLYSVSSNHDTTINGFKLRALFTVPHAEDRHFFYAANFEFSRNARYWDTRRTTSEIRPIVGWHFHPVDVILNPILDTSYNGVRNLDFAPAERIAYNLPSAWTIAAEEYADYGPVGRFLPSGEVPHQLFGVVDHTFQTVAVEAGVGYGLTGVASRLTMKLMLSRDLN
jgi:hypothetical protein